MVKNPTANAGDIRNMGLIPGLGRPLEKGMATHSSILAWEIPGKNGQKSLAGYSPWGCKESDMTEATWRQRRWQSIQYLNLLTMKIPPRGISRIYWMLTIPIHYS